MAESSYEVDSDGDLLIILSIPSGPFAPWEIVEAPGPSQPTDSLVIESFTLSALDVPTDERTPDGVQHSSHQLQLKVSSKHLTMASSRFKKMLSGNWVEAKTIHPDGYRHVELEGLDPNATTIVLNILHGKTRKVPRIVDLELLAKIAVVVDDLGCDEEVELFSDMWIQQSRGTVPSEYGRDLILWILISSVFRKPSLFKSATRTAISQSPGPIQTLGLPIRRRFVDEINGQREGLVEDKFTALYELLDRLRTRDVCSFECQSILLGALIKNMSPLNLLEPRPLKPFDGFSFAQITQAVHRFRTPIWYSEPLQPLPEKAPPEKAPSEKSKNRKRSAPPSSAPLEKTEGCGNNVEQQKYQKHQCSLRDYLPPAADRIDGLELSGG